jgi:hypothetical protein
MALDLSMFRQNPLRSAAEYEGDYQKLDLNRQTLAENALALRSKQMAAAEAAQIKNVLAGLGANATDEQRITALKSTGLSTGFAAADALEKAIVEKRKGLATAAKTEQEAEAEKIKKRVAAMAEVYSGLQRAPTKEAAQEVLGMGYQSGGIGSFKAASTLAKQVEEAWGSAEARKKFLDDMGLSLVEQSKRFEQEQQNFRNKVTTDTQIATNKATNDRMAAEGAANRGVQWARLKFDKDKEKNDSKTAKPDTVVDPLDKNRMIRIDLNKWDEAKYLAGDKSAVIGVAGKEPAAALRENAAMSSRNDALDLIAELRSAYDTLDRNRAIPSTDRSAVSNALSSLAASGVGQIAGRIVATPEQTERDVISSAKKRMMIAITKAMGLKGGSLNSNRELDTWLSAVTDPSQSKETADRVLDSIEKFVKSGGKYTERPKAPDTGGDLPAGFQEIN